MNDFRPKRNKSEDMMIHMLNNLPKKYDVILNGLENHLSLSGDDALMTDFIREKVNHM